MVQVGNDQFYEVLDKASGQKGKDDWAKLQKLMRPLAKAATAVPPIAIRADPGVAVTAVARYLPRLLSGGPDALKLIGPFSKVNNTRGCVCCSVLCHLAVAPLYFTNVVPILFLSEIDRCVFHSCVLSLC